jgi:hypothetical protein
MVVDFPEEAEEEDGQVVAEASRVAEVDLAEAAAADPGKREAGGRMQ